MASLCLLLIPLTFLMLLLIHHHLKARRQYSSMPSPRSLPFIGHMLIMKPDIQETIEQIMAMANLYPSHPRMVTFWLGPVPTIMLYSATLVEAVFSNMEHLNKGMSYEMLRPWLGNGLLTSYAEQWRPRRKLLTPTFHYEILKNFLYIFNSQSRILVQKLRVIAENNNNVIGDITPLVSLCALDIICETSMGQTVNAQSESNSIYVKAVARINDIIQRRQKNPLMWMDTFFSFTADGKEHFWALNVLHSFTRKVIVERKEMRKNECFRECGNTGRQAFLDLLLEMEHNGELNDQDIQQEVDTFMFEGHDTTSTAVVWTLFILGCNQKVQQRVCEEITSVCGNSDDVSIEQLGKLTYLECCIKEVLRLYPSVPFIARCLGSDAFIGGNKVTANTQVMINIYLIHRDPEQWEDPEFFDPDRFLRENMAKRHPFSYVPFSAGSRNCIGQRFAILEEKTMLVWILRNFRIKSVQRRDQIRHKAELILRPAKEVSLILVPRN